MEKENSKIDTPICLKKINNMKVFQPGPLNVGIPLLPRVSLILLDGTCPTARIGHEPKHF